MALELILRSLLKSKKFVNSSSDEKDWQNISKLIPGATPKQCANKWEELTSQNSWLLKPGVKSDEHFNDDVGLDAVVDYLLIDKDESSGEDEQGTTDNQNNKIKTVDQTNTSKKEQEHSSKPNKSEDVSEQKKDPLSSSCSSIKKLKPKPITPDGPNMVIHVCDESKNLKQDFSCPRDLLVKEMKYFAEYLSLEPQRWEEVDISVHCDVQIFDWLMHYAKRDMKTSCDDTIPRLEANNVISILISSDFLRMDSLVTKCIHYCHENMSTILSTPCNMNCINDKLVTRISKLFNHTELDAVKDRKDKFKSKLFCKKIEEFVNTSASSGPDNASTLFRCTSCKKLLTTNSQSNIPCAINRMNIDSRGQMSYGHVRDTSWDINDFLLGLKEKLKSWRDVYWRLWGSVTVLYCYHCHCYFSCTELGHCRYHTQSTEYTEGPDPTIVGIYPCCQHKVLRYDSIGVLSGCHVKDHVITPVRCSNVASGKIDNDKNEESKSSEDDATPPRTAINNGDQYNPSDIENESSIIKDLMTHRDVISLPFQRVASARTSELNIFLEDELLGNSKLPAGYTKILSANVVSAERKTVNDTAASLPPIRRNKTGISLRMPSSRRKTAILKSDYSTSTEEEEEEDDEVEHNVKVSSRHFQRARKKQSSENRPSSGFKWDPQRSQRWNQDAQREEDSKRMTEVINAMAKLRSAANQERKTKGKEFPGGIFHKLDHQFRISTQPPSIKHQTSNSQLTSGSRTRRAVVKS